MQPSVSLKTLKLQQDISVELMLLCCLTRKSPESKPFCDVLPGAYVPCSMRFLRLHTKILMAPIARIATTQPATPPAIGPALLPELDEAETEATGAKAGGGGADSVGIGVLVVGQMFAQEPVDRPVAKDQVHISTVGLLGKSLQYFHIELSVRAQLRIHNLLIIYKVQGQDLKFHLLMVYGCLQMHSLQDLKDSDDACIAQLMQSVHESCLKHRTSELAKQRNPHWGPVHQHR